MRGKWLQNENNNGCRNGERLQAFIDNINIQHGEFEIHKWLIKLLT